MYAERGVQAVFGRTDFSALDHIGLAAQAPVSERVVLDHPSIGLELFEERRVPRRHRRDQEHRERHVRGRHEPVRRRQPGLSIVHREEGDPLVGRQTLEDRRDRSAARYRDRRRRRRGAKVGMLPLNAVACPRCVDVPA